MMIYDGGSQGIYLFQYFSAAGEEQENDGKSEYLPYLQINRTD